MPNISPAAIALIQAHIADWTPDDATILASLSVAAIANPTAQPTIGNPIYESELMGRLSAASLCNIRGYANLASLKADIAVSNVDGLLHWFGLLAITTESIPGVITSDEATALSGYIMGTQLDPAWPALVSWAHINIGRELDLSDIAASRPGA